MGSSNEIKVFEFSETELLELEVRKVRGADNKTQYTVGKNENGNFLKSVSDNAASGLGKKIRIDGYLEEFSLSRKEADDLIMAAREIAFK